MKKLLALCALLALSVTACTMPGQGMAGSSDSEAMPRGSYAVTGSDVTYHNSIKGYLSAPTDNPNAPGVVLIHEWWGLNANMKDTADRIASHGYRVLAVDLYNGESTTDAGTAQKLSATVTPDEVKANLGNAVDYLHGQGSSSVASWGFCFGGGKAMDLALTGVPVDATVVYYGSLKSALANPTLVDVPVLLIYGTNDTVTPVTDARTLAGKLRTEGIAVQLEVYEGQGHAFANPSNAKHDPKATRDAWDKTLAFLNANII